MGLDRDCKDKRKPKQSGRVEVDVVEAKKEYDVSSGLPVLRKYLGSLGPLTSRVEEERKQAAGLGDWLGRNHMPLVPRKDVVVPGTVIKDLLKTQVQSLPERFPSPPSKDIAKMERKLCRRMNYYTHGDTQQL